MKDITYAAPKTVADATALLNDKGDRARILAGGTDIIVQVREGRRDIDALVDIKHITEVNELTLDAKGLTIGAAVPCCVIYENQAIAKAYPGLIDAVSLIGGIQIQSRASLGGNLCNGSPAADGIPRTAFAMDVPSGWPRGSRVKTQQFSSMPGLARLCWRVFAQMVQAHPLKYSPFAFGLGRNPSGPRARHRHVGQA